MGWKWRDVENATAITYETFRALNDGQPRRMRASTKRQIEAGLGWAAGAVDAIFDGGEPEVRRGWRPPSGAGYGDQDDYQRTLLAALGLGAADLAEAQARFTAGHAAIRVIAEQLADVAGMDLDAAVQDLLFLAAGGAIRKIFAAERQELDELAQLRSRIRRTAAGGHSG
jgi:hypothetical protein